MTTVETKLEIIFVNKLYSKTFSKVISLDFGNYLGCGWTLS